MNELTCEASGSVVEKIFRSSFGAWEHKFLPALSISATSAGEKKFSNTINPSRSNWKKKHETRYEGQRVRRNNFEDNDDFLISKLHIQTIYHDLVEAQTEAT